MPRCLWNTRTCLQNGICCLELQLQTTTGWYYKAQSTKRVICSVVCFANASPQGKCRWIWTAIGVKNNWCSFERKGFQNNEEWQFPFSFERHLSFCVMKMFQLKMSTMLQLGRKFKNISENTRKRLFISCSDYLFPSLPSLTSGNKKFTWSRDKYCGHWYWKLISH